MELFKIDQTRLNIHLKQVFMTHRIIKNQICKRCNNMTWMKNTNAMISTYFCSRCIYYYSSISRTIMHSSKISYSQLYLVMNSFINDNSIKQCMNECRKYYSPLSHLTIGKYYKKFRSLLNFFVKDEMDNLILEGPVEIDETMLYKFKRGQANGRHSVIRIWLVGIKSRTTGHFVIYPLTSRKKDILYTIILKHVPYGSIVYSDCWGAYVNNKVTPKTSLLTRFGYIHFFVCHDIQFVSNFENHIHINTVERLWRSIKKYVRIFNPRVFIHEYISKTYLNQTRNYNQQLELLMNLCSKCNI